MAQGKYTRRPDACQHATARNRGPLRRPVRRPADHSSDSGSGSAWVRGDRTSPEGSSATTTIRRRIAPMSMTARRALSASSCPTLRARSSRMRL